MRVGNEIVKNTLIWIQRYIAKRQFRNYIILSENSRKRIWDKSNISKKYNEKQRLKKYQWIPMDLILRENLIYLNSNTNFMQKRYNENLIVHGFIDFLFHIMNVLILKPVLRKNKLSEKIQLCYLFCIWLVLHSQ